MDKKNILNKFEFFDSGDVTLKLNEAYTQKKELMLELIGNEELTKYISYIVKDYFIDDTIVIMYDFSKKTYYYDVFINEKCEYVRADIPKEVLINEIKNDNVVELQIHY